MNYEFQDQKGLKQAIMHFGSNIIEQLSFIHYKIVNTRSCHSI